MRGMAAVTVVAQHCLLVSPWIGGGMTADASRPLWVAIAEAPPFSALWSGSEAVTLFFVLSGFVLALPFFRGPVSLPGWLARRALRIYPPYLAAVALAVGLWYATRHAPPTSTSQWFDAIGSVPPTPRLLLEHVLLIGSFDNDAFLPVVWSLVIEMRISLAFPLLMVLVLAARWWQTLVVCLLLFVLGRGTHWWANASGVLPGDHFATLMHVYPFAVGALLARHRRFLVERLGCLNTGVRVCLWIFAFALYQYAALVPDAWETTSRRVFGHFPTVTGIALAILLTLGSDAARRWLVRAPLVYLGRISYSLYLVHTVVLVAAVRLLGSEAVAPATLFVIVLCASLALATLSWWAIERPSIALSRAVGRRLERRPLREAGRPGDTG